MNLTHQTADQTNGRHEGERLRDAALDLHEQRRADALLIARRAFTEHLLREGRGTVEDVVEGLPDVNVDPRYRGAIPRPFASRGAIEKAGYVSTKRPQAHSRPTAVWRVVDRDALCRWLRDNPSRPSARHPPPPKSEARQVTLPGFGDSDFPFNSDEERYLRCQ